MTLKEFGETIEFNIEHNIKHAILGLGAPGVGKSRLIHQIGERFGYKVIDIRLAQMSEVEIGGLIYPNEDRTKTRWLSPEILPDEERDGKNTILLLDEITSCQKRVQVAAYQLILDRRVGQYRLPEGCFVIALGNREDDDGVYIHLAGPLADRFEIHYIDVDFNSWKNDFALKNNIHPLVVDYLSFKPAALHTQNTLDENMDDILFATPRSWERVSDILNIDEDVSKTVIKNKIIGNIGKNEGLQFVEYCKSKDEFVKAGDYLGGIKKEPDNPEEVAILVDAMVDQIKYIAAYNVKSEMTPYQIEEVENVLRGMFKFEKSEYTVIGVKKMLEINRRVVKEIFFEMDDKNIIRFIEENQFMLM